MRQSGTQESRAGHAVAASGDPTASRVQEPELPLVSTQGPDFLRDTTEGQANAENGAAPVLYAIADTHLGLRQGAWREYLAERKLVDLTSDEPSKVADFLRWLEDIPLVGWNIQVLETSQIVTRTLRRATRLVLLGDIVELWDAENEGILLSSVPVNQVLSLLRAEKTYVLGNHDSVLEYLQGPYPYGVPGLEIVRGAFPPPGGDGKIHPLRVGDESYVFVHGHQLDLAFRLATRLNLLNILGRLRQFGAATGPYALVIFGLLLLVAIPLVFFTPSIPGWILVATLFLLALPRLFMRVARPLFNFAVATKKYRRSRALRGFLAWWKGFRGTLEATAELGIVFGHTHYLDWIEYPQATRSLLTAGKPGIRLLETFRSERRKRQSLYNISAWVKVAGPHADVVRASLFYVDGRGPLILGWDWDQKRPFHIPFPFILKKRDPAIQEAFTREELETVRMLGWPDRLIERWQKERIKG